MESRFERCAPGHGALVFALISLAGCGTQETEVASRPAVASPTDESARPRERALVDRLHSLSSERKQALREDLSNLDAELAGTRQAMDRVRNRQALLERWLDRFGDDDLSVSAALRQQITEDPAYRLDVMLAQKELLAQGTRLEPTPSDLQAIAEAQAGEQP